MNRFDITSTIRKLEAVFPDVRVEAYVETGRMYRPELTLRATVRRAKVDCHARVNVPLDEYAMGMPPDYAATQLVHYITKELIRSA
jgi:hypothetical protein